MKNSPWSPVGQGSASHTSRYRKAAGLNQTAPHPPSGRALGPNKALASKHKLEFSAPRIQSEALTDTNLEIVQGESAKRATEQGACRVSGAKIRRVR